MHYKYSQDNEKQIGNLLTFMFLHDMVTITIVTFTLQTFTFKNASIPSIEGTFQNLRFQEKSIINPTPESLYY